MINGLVLFTHGCATRAFDAIGKSLWILLALREESLASHCIVEVGFRGGKIRYAASLSVVDGSEGKGPE